MPVQVCVCVSENNERKSEQEEEKWKNEIKVKRGGGGERVKRKEKGEVCNRRTFQIVVDGDKWRTITLSLHANCSCRTTRDLHMFLHVFHRDSLRPSSPYPL